MSIFLKPIETVLHVIPDKIHARILSQLGRHFMQGQDITSRLDLIEGKRLKFTITDTGNCWKFIISNGCMYEDTKSTQDPDIHIQADLKTFLLLATRHEDPDSLFFSRQLSIEGNTEDGLYIKNIIDAMDFDSTTYLKSVLGQKLALQIAPMIEKFEIGKRLHSLSETLLVKH